MPRFSFAFDPLYQLAGLPFGITPRTSGVAVEDDTLTIRFGPWKLSTPLDNIAGCQPSGPYSFPRVAGPAHLSFADHGMTCATNGDCGLCIRFIEPVHGFDPWGMIQSPGVTVTVDRIDDLRELLTDVASSENASDPVVMEQPMRVLKRLVAWPAGMITAALQYPGVVAAVSRRSRRAGDVDTTWVAQHGDRIQGMEAGVGPVYVRRYRARINGTKLEPNEIMDRFASNLNLVAPEVAEFVEQSSGKAASVDQEFEIRMPGPWNAPVRVVDRTPSSIRLATLEGHMEAGEIEFSCHRPDHSEGRADAVVFQIESVARCGDHLFEIVYDRLLIAREMQLFMWVTVCRGIAALIGGTIDGKIAVETMRVETNIPTDDR